MNRVLFDGTALQSATLGYPRRRMASSVPIKFHAHNCDGAHWTCSKVRLIPHQKLREDLATDSDLPSIATSV